MDNPDKEIELQFIAAKNALRDLYELLPTHMDNTVYSALNKLIVAEEEWEEYQRDIKKERQDIGMSGYASREDYEKDKKR